MNNFGSSVVGPCRIFCGIKDAEPLFSSAKIYSCAELTAPRDSNASKSSGVVFHHSSPASILRRTALPKILTAIIKHVVVFVVALFARTASETLPMHRYILPLSIFRTGQRATGKPTVSLQVPASPPVELRQRGEVGSINDGVFTLRKWNQTVGFIERLNNRVSLHAVFRPLSYHGRIICRRINPT